MKIRDVGYSDRLTQFFTGDLVGGDRQNGIAQIKDYGDYCNNDEYINHILI